MDGPKPALGVGVRLLRVRGEREQGQDCSGQYAKSGWHVALLHSPIPASRPIGKGTGYVLHVLDLVRDGFSQLAGWLHKPRRRGLAVFDIDGTLTDTNAVDDECYLRAVAEVLGITASLDWSEAPHVTDSALLHWLCERFLARTARDGEIEAVKIRFLALLRSELAARPARFRHIPGAEDVLVRLRALGWDVALATGGWEESARLKLGAISLDPAGIPFASGSDALTRRDILELALARTSARYSRVVSIGDGVWDVQAATQLGWPFVGIAPVEKADRLRAAGAEHVLEDLTDTALLLDALEMAPQAKASA